MTLDGKIAAADGASRWITGEAARLEGHRLRFAADAILVGIGTVLADDPQLTVRHPGLPAKEPLRVVVDSRLRIPGDARVLRAGDPARALVACVAPAPAGPAGGAAGAGVRVLELPGDSGRVDLRALLEALRALDVIAVLAEGGGELGGALAEAGLVDRVAFFVAPRLLGGREAPGPLGGRGRAAEGSPRAGRRRHPPARRGPARRGRRPALGHVHGDRRDARPGRKAGDRGGRAAAQGGGAGRPGLAARARGERGGQRSLPHGGGRAGRDELAFDLAEETLRVTTLGGLGVGDPVNLERPLRLRRAARRPSGSGPRRRRGAGHGGPAGGRRRAGGRGGARGASGRS